MSQSEHASFVDSTIRLKWELTKEKFDSCEFVEKIHSHNFIVQLGTKTSEWFITMYPRGDEEDRRNRVTVYIELARGDKKDYYDTVFGFGVETDKGYWPNGDLVEKMYSNQKVREYEKLSYIFNLGTKDSYGIDKLSTTEEFLTKFVQNKLTFVATLVFRMEGKRYIQEKEVVDDFVKDMRSLSLQENYSDVAIICSGKKFPSHKVLLAARSEYFEALFRNDQQKKEVKIEDASPEMVETMLNFITKGLIPSDIGTKAVDLIAMADKYQIELLSRVCLSSMVDNLSTDNALETLVTVDKLKHLSNMEQRDHVLAFIKKEKDKIVKGENWETFVLSYPSLVTEIVLSL